MSGPGFLKDRVWLYLLLAALVSAFTAAVLLLPYGTVYVRDRAYLSLFLGTIIACVAVFALGTVYNMLVWMRGSGLKGAPEGRALRLLPKAFKLMLTARFWESRAVFAKEALYLSKLKGRSTSRWAMHLLILGGFAGTLVLDLVVTFSLDIAKWDPMIAQDGWAKLWVRDFAFDLLGLALLAGLAIAAARRFVLRPPIVRTELPDAASIVFLLAVVLGGFVLEGMGIAGRIPGHASDNRYSFLGYALAQLMPASAGDYYDQAWLVHGVMSALLIAYIPFSKLFHMIATPFAIEIDEMLGREARKL